MKNLQIPDLTLELSNLYYATGFEFQEGLSMAMFNPETGEEIGADILTPMLNNITQPIEDKDEDSLCDAALFIYPDTEYSQEKVNLDINFTYDNFISKEQRNLNGQFMITKVINARNFFELKIARESFLTLSKKPWALNDKDKTVFWQEYNITKEYLNNNKRNAA